MIHQSDCEAEVDELIGVNPGDWGRDPQILRRKGLKELLGLHEILLYSIMHTVQEY